MEDLNRLAESREAAQYGNDLIEKVMESKLLDLHCDKSSYLLFGSKSARNKLQTELKDNPLNLCGIPMKEVKAIKFLGDYVSHSLEDSVHQTVSKRIGIARQSIYEIRAVVEDARSKTLGGINVAFTIWSVAVIPMLLWNAETWTNIP